MLWLYIVLPIAAVLAYLMFAPVGVRFKLNRQGNANVYICYGVLQFKIKKKTEEQKQKKEAKKQLKEQKKQEKQAKKKSKGKAKKSGKKTDKKPQDKKSNGIFAKVKAGGISFILEVFRDISKIVADAGRYSQKHLHLVIKELDINIANEDPAVTGQMYGYVCAAVYPVINAVEGLIKLNIKRLRITPDFMSEQLHASCDIKLWIVPIFAFRLALSLLKNGYKFYSKHLASDSEEQSDKAAARN